MNLAHHWVLATRQPARRGQILVLAVGLLVSAMSFVLLSAAATTGQVRVQGEVQRTLRAAYDILVRPPSVTDPGRSLKLVPNNFESGLYGGISLAEWHSVEHAPGVEVAAPVANLGYVMPFVEIDVPLARYLQPGHEQLLRITTTFLPNGGLGRIPGRTGYYYVPPASGSCDGKSVFGPPSDRPFVTESPADPYLVCAPAGGGAKRSVSFELSFPLLVAAIDPGQENKLLRINRAIVEGAPLGRTDKVSVDGAVVTLPVLASSRVYQDEPMRADVEDVSAPHGQTLGLLLTDPHPPVHGDPDSPNLPYRRVTPLPGRQLGSVVVSSQHAYSALLNQLAQPTSGEVGTYWTSSPVTYAPANTDRIASSRILLPRQVRNDPQTTWQDTTQASQYAPVPLDNADVQYRRLTPHPGQPVTVAGVGQSYVLGFNPVGTFDPTRLPGFDPNSQVPLETYYPPVVTPADAASRAALHGRPLTPTANLGDYLAQPPFLLTTLAAAQGMTSPRFFAGANAAAPISVIRVRVAGVTGIDKLSLARIQATATAIRRATGLAVDVTAGSSPEQQTVHLAAGRFGQPALTVHEGWSKLGVATVILHAVDTKSRLLVVLILLVSVFFAASAISANLRARRTEIGVLRCLGWRRRQVFALVLAEPVVVGLVAGALGAVAALGLIRLAGLAVPTVQVLLIPPVAVGLALVAGLVPAALASRQAPLAAVAPAVTVSRRREAPPVRAVSGLALRALRRRPGRVLAGVLALAVGVAALTTLVAVNLAFRGSVTDSLIGHVVTVQVRGTDYLAVAVIVALGALGVADVLLVNVREQAVELAVLRATGWDLRRLAAVPRVQGLALGAAGALLGAVVGVGLGRVLGGPIGPLLAAAGLACLAGLVVVTAATVVPARLTRRLPVAGLLSAE